MDQSTGELELRGEVDQSNTEAVVVSVCVTINYDQNSELVTQEISVHLQDLGQCEEITLETDTQTIELLESTIVATQFLRMVASSVNCPQNGIEDFSYQIVSGNIEDMFSLNEDSGILSVKRDLSGAKDETYYVTIVAYNSAEDSTYFSNEVDITIRIVRDRSCVIRFRVDQQISFTVPRAEVGEETFSVKIGNFGIQSCQQTPPTWGHKFQLLSTENADAFIVDSGTGNLYLIENMKSSRFNGIVVLRTENNGKIFQIFVIEEI